MRQATEQTAVSSVAKRHERTIMEFAWKTPSGQLDVWSEPFGVVGFMITEEEEAEVMLDADQVAELVKVLTE